MIEIDNLFKSFGRLEVLKGISAKMERGKVTCIIGPNGSGKTTLIKSVLGMVIPDSGEISVRGNTIKGDVLYRREIGYMPQIGRYPENMTIDGLFKLMKSIRHDMSDYDLDLYKNFSVENMLSKTMKTLSGGTTQKISATLAFLFNPSIYILDEPTAGLDPIASEILKEKIHSVKQQGKLVILTSHIMSEIDEIADMILYIHEGKVRFYDSINNIKNNSGEDKLGRAIAKMMREGSDA